MAPARKTAVPTTKAPKAGSPTVHARPADAPPTDADIARVLGDAFPAFQALASQDGKATSEWKRYSRNSPWVLKVTVGKRALFYARPDGNVLKVTVVLGERAARAALEGRVRTSLHDAIRAAKVYPEGRPVETRVRRRTDLAGVEELIAVKLETTGQPAKR
jgi:hypothetical protein